MDYKYLLLLIIVVSCSHPSGKCYLNLTDPPAPTPVQCPGLSKSYTPIPFSPNNPEPWASMTDVITASQLLEDAIHGANTTAVQGKLTEARGWLCHALV